MTRRLQVLRSLIAPPEIIAAIVAAFPGAIVTVDASGVVTNAWMSATAPISVLGAVGHPLHAVLGLADDDVAAGQLQLWVACAVGVDNELFTLSLGDPPRHVPAAVGRGALDLTYGPVFDPLGITTAVAVFVTAAAHDSTARPAVVEAASAEEIERFFVEIQPLLEDCHAELKKLDADREARQSVNRMFRAMHTIKGAARAAGLGPIAGLAHDIEARFAMLREPRHVVSNEDLAAVRGLLDQLGQQILVDAPLDAVLDAMASLYAAYRPAMARTEEAFTAWQSRARDVELAEAFARAVNQLAEVVAPYQMHALGRHVSTLVRLTETAHSTSRPERRLLAALDQHLARVHQLVELYQEAYRELRASDCRSRLIRELVAIRTGPMPRHAARDLAAKEGLAAIARACERAEDADAIGCMLEDLPAMFAPTDASLDARAPLSAAQRTLLEAADSMKLLAGQAADVAPIEAKVRKVAERLTWMGFDEMFRRVRRLATTLAAEQGKQVALEINARGVVVPEVVHRVVNDVLMHAVRNAIDHGIETVAERRACGKTAAGRMCLSITCVGDVVELEIVDDGRGIDVERVRAKATAGGLIRPDAVLATAQLHDLVFSPGLSTSDRVTEISGRGVGMDVVRSAAEGLGGAATISSEHGRWTQLVVRVPLHPHMRSDGHSTMPPLETYG
ncbi:MAG: Hpt domain-containing protein [Deltaproteobacteria bacterium]|nr:Hpt domain-containing protein [Deltaproteobacteria bacterium]